MIDEWKKDEERSNKYRFFAESRGGWDKVAINVDGRVERISGNMPTQRYQTMAHINKEIETLQILRDAAINHFGLGWHG